MKYELVHVYGIDLAPILPTATIGRRHQEHDTQSAWMTSCVCVECLISTQYAQHAHCVFKARHGRVLAATRGC